MHADEVGRPLPDVPLIINDDGHGIIARENAPEILSVVSNICSKRRKKSQCVNKKNTKHSREKIGGHIY
jgi:hypothetical protein